MSEFEIIFSCLIGLKERRKSRSLEAKVRNLNVRTHRCNEQGYTESLCDTGGW